MAIFDGIFRKLTTQHNMGTASVGFQGRKFGIRSANAAEARVTVTFVTAGAPVPVYHGLKRVPSQFIVISKSAAGNIYNELPFQADSRTLVVKSDTAMVAELIVR